MGWATHYIERLRNGETVHFRPHGGSMKGRVESGQLCTVAPIADHGTLRVGDVVLCKVRGSEYLHIVKAIQDGCFQIGNNLGRINGWVSHNAIFGKLVEGARDPESLTLVPGIGAGAAAANPEAVAMANRNRPWRPGRREHG